MKFSENWLRQHVRTNASRDELAATLTAIGLEVEGMTSLGESLDGVVVARIVTAERHPEADRLQVCQVDAGQGALLQIVCGAPNARPGLRVPLATVGARVGDMAIGAAKLRGVESNGMLCSAKELGLDADASGLLELPDDAPVGTPLAEYLGLPDASIELKLTPNRADCFSVRGIAYDVAAACGSEVAAVEAVPMPALNGEALKVELDAGAKVPRFVGRVITGIDAGAATPVWMRERLRRSDVRPISLLVDVTQYVMLELGQPMHAFDRDTLTQPIVVRPARAGEQTRLLDGRTVTLDEDFLVVSDSQGGRAARAVALGGIMGGYDTRVTDATRNVFLEAAHWIPSAIIGLGRRLGLHTDAGHRFERGVDPELPRQAIEMATRLIVELAGGSPGPLTEAMLPEHLSRPAPILLRRERLARVLGTTVADEEVGRILRALGLDVEDAEQGWRATPPTRRFDLAIEEDLIEEVARIHGYDAIPATLPGGGTRLVVPSETEVAEADLRRQLVARDYLEAVNYAFVDATLLATWQAMDGAVPLANPLSAELGVMRTQLLPGLAAALARNAARQQSRVRLFEIGKVFNAGQKQHENWPIETVRLASVASGASKAEHWEQEGSLVYDVFATDDLSETRIEPNVEKNRPVDFHDLKGDLDSLAALSGATLEYRASNFAFGHPGRTAEILRVDGEPARIGWIGELHPRLRRALDLDHAVVAFEVDLAALQRRRVPKAAALSKFPSVRRDLAFVVAENVNWASISATVTRIAGPVLREITLFDRYVGKGVRTGFKSLAMGLILQDDSRTLTDRDVDAVIARVIDGLRGDHGARMRE